MNKLFILIFIVLLFFSFSCMSGPNPQNLELIQRVFSKTDSPVVLKAEEGFKAMKNGESSVFRKLEGETQLYLRFSVYKGPDGSNWLEVLEVGEKEEMVLQYKVKNLKAESIRDLDIIEGRYYKNDKRKDRKAMDMTYYLAPLFQREKAKAYEATMKTPAGIFKTVYASFSEKKLRYAMKKDAFLINIDEVKSGAAFYHPLVPMNGLLAWKTDKVKAELVEFSPLGAVPARPL